MGRRAPGPFKNAAWMVDSGWIPRCAGPLLLIPRGARLSFHDPLSTIHDPRRIIWEYLYGVQIVASNDGYYEALWPRSPRQAKVKALAPRLDTLDGKTVAQVWDYVFRGNEVFEFLEEGLKARFPGVRFVSWREFGNTHGHEERAVVAALPAKFKALGVDAVISGMGC
jgi:hypothetical protein